MMQGKVSTTGRRFMGRLPKGADLLDALTAICVQHAITLGEVRALGAVASAKVGFYDQERRVYETLSFDQELEIVHCLGNISIKDGRPMVHAHITYSDTQGRAFGGHLVQGNPIFACEFVIKEYKSDTQFIRSLDEETGLYLWR